MNWKEWFHRKSICAGREWGSIPTINIEEEERYQAYKARLLDETKAQLIAVGGLKPNTAYEVTLFIQE